MNDVVAQDIEDTRHVVRRFEKEIKKFVNKKWTNGTQMAGIVATSLLQNIIINITSRMHTRGDDAGAEFIKTVYTAAQADAVRTWAEQLNKG